MEYKHKTQWGYRLMSEFRHVVYYYGITSLKKFDINIEIFDGKSRLGFYSSSDKTIGISAKMIANQPWYIVVEVLKHEIAHLIADVIFNATDHTPHGPVFHQCCDMIGVSKWGRKATGSIEKFKQQNTMTEEDYKLISRAEKLMALSKSPNPHEAALALSRLEAMQDKYNIDAMQKNNLNVGSFVYSFNKKRKPSWSSKLINLVCEIYHLSAIYFNNYNATDNTVYSSVELFGSTDSLELAEYTLGFIIRSAEAAYKNYDGKKGVKAKNSFMRSFIVGCGENLQRMRKETDDQMVVNTDEKALVLVKANQLIKKEAEKALSSKYPRIRTTRSYYSNDGAASDAGFEAGKNTSVNQGINKSSGPLAITS